MPLGGIMREIRAGDYSLDPLAKIVNADGTELCIIRQPREADIWAMEDESRALQKRARAWQKKLVEKADKRATAGEGVDEFIDSSPVPRDLSTAYLYASRVAVLSEPRVTADQLLEALPLGVLNELHAEAMRITSGGEPKKDPSGT